MATQVTVKFMSSTVISSFGSVTLLRKILNNKQPVLLMGRPRSFFHILNTFYRNFFLAYSKSTFCHVLSSGEVLSLLFCYRSLFCLCGVLFQKEVRFYSSIFPLLNGVLLRNLVYLYEGVLGNKLKYNLENLFSYRLSNSNDIFHFCLNSSYSKIISERIRYGY